MISVVFTFSPENYTLGSKTIYMTFAGGKTWQILISGLDFSGGAIKFAIHTFTKLQLGVAQLAPMNNLPLPPLVTYKPVRVGYNMNLVMIVIVLILYMSL